jgi:hypothetical protein
MEPLTHKLILEGKYSGNVITTNLPQELDNALYTLIHFIGGMDFGDVSNFAHNASDEEIRMLTTMVNNFPKTIQEIMPLAGNYKVLRQSPQYQQIINLVKREEKQFYLDEGLNDLVYREKPKEKHIKRMEKDWGELSGFPIEKFKNSPPPENESNTAENEIEHLDKIPVDEKFVTYGDDLDMPFEKFLKSKDLDYPIKLIKKYMPGVRSIILNLKYHYNRPRPGQLADAKGIDFDPESLKSASTPSYPSGHAAQGRFIARLLSELYPEYEQELMNIGDDIAYSRNMAKVHYPSDTAFGKELGDELYEYVYEPQLEPQLAEDVQYDAEGFPTIDTSPYILRYITPKLKEKLYRYWDSIGEADYNALKLFGIEEDVDEYSSSFSNIGDVLYPILALDWIGGVDNTEFAKSGWRNTKEMGFEDLKFKVEPIGYDYLFDESVNFGEHGYACWDIRVLIDVNETASLDDSDRLKELFPESAQNKVSSFHNYTDEQFEVIEGLWDYYHQEASEYWTQFCKVEVVLV